MIISPAYAKRFDNHSDRKTGIHWDSDQWVSYDDSQTLMMKKSFANSRCLGK